MNHIDAFGLDYKYIELNRTFHELTSNYENDDADIRQVLGLGGRLSWQNLVEDYRLIILSEAGSGKTAEIRNIAHDLKSQGKDAFFLRLEHISNDFEDAFEIGTYNEFESWLTSGREGWLLLDSVDEARLRSPGDFELAIRKLSRRILNAKDRTHIVITSRTTAWRPKTDLAHCSTHLPFALAKTKQDGQEDNDTEGELTTATQAETKGSQKSVFKIVALDDLTSEQIAMFAMARGIKDSTAFLNAIERADAWSFTSRPQDLEELTEFWNDKGKIGTRLEIMRNSISRRLTERDQRRGDSKPLSAKRTLEGARLLAATTTLSHNQTIRIPDGAANLKGISIQSVLPDWDDKDQATLISRPIFDEAIYGTVRFHHRSVREYLTAEWFAELLERSVSRRKIERLFFRNQYGLDIVSPTLRPILPWLAILDEKIRERVHKIAPEIIFEGGDPSMLPLDVRRNILHEVCEQMAEGDPSQSVKDYSAVQRFSNHDLVGDVRILLKKYSGNEDLTSFLLRMVWLGKLGEALPEVMTVALNPSAGRYPRTSAFRAINAIASNKELELVRQSFLAEVAELKREWLAELVSGVIPTEHSVVWLMACLEKSNPKEQYTVDYLVDSVNEFVDAAEIELLTQIITGLNKLLNTPPVIERRHCEVSERFQWLLEPASKAVKRLILIRDHEALKKDSLDILHKLPVGHAYGVSSLSKLKDEFSNLVPEWQELSRKLFWFEVQRSREAQNRKRGERLTNYWHASIFGSFWQFDESDFDYICDEIISQPFLDDKMVALSVAFNIYRNAKRPRAWRERLKKLVVNNDELSKRLSSYLKPPAQSPDERRWKQQDAKWKRQKNARQKKQEKYHADWKKIFSERLDEARAAVTNNPGIITNPLHYLHEQARDRSSTTGRWTEYNWKTLITEYGEEVAHFYRDSTVSFWRHYIPKLRSEGAPINKTSYGVIIGLTGIEIEAIETEDWPKNMSNGDVELACKYASFELNGFPTWFPKLFEMHRRIVSDFLMQEVQYELSIESPDKETHYVIDDLGWSGQWAWDHLAPRIHDIIKREPANLSNLDTFLKIIQGSNFSDELIKKLACRKCRTLKSLDHLARWYALWVDLAPEDGIAALNERLGAIDSSEDQTKFAMSFITNLLGGRRGDGLTARQVINTPQHLKSLYLIMQKYIRHEDDIDRAGKGVYSPGLRDDAQDARNRLFSLLNQIPGKESYLALTAIAEANPARPWIMYHAKTKAEQDGDNEPWLPAQVRDYYEKFEITPKNHRELAELAVLRFLDLKDDLEQGDSSIADILKTVTLETDMRKFIGRELREKAFGRYSIPQEEELADAKRPDLRFHGVEFDGPVPVELKLADNWSGPHLFERLENQLCRDYLRDNRSSQGVFVLVHRGEKNNWDDPNTGNRVDFNELMFALEEYWSQISPKFPNVDKIAVIGIDLLKRSN